MPETICIFIGKKKSSAKRVVRELRDIGVVGMLYPPPRKGDCWRVHVALSDFPAADALLFNGKEG